MNRVREVLLRACAEELQSHIRQLRDHGWPAEVVAVNDDGFFGIRVEIRLDGVRVPVETTNEEVIAEA